MSIKTTVSDASVEDFLNTIPSETKRADAFELLKLFNRVTGEKPKLWGGSMVGYGLYHYKSERSRQEGDWFLTGFAPRRQALTLYLTSGFAQAQDLLQKLGKHKTGVGCVYINKLADVDMAVLDKLVAKSFAAMKQVHLQ